MSTAIVSTDPNMTSDALFQANINAFHNSIQTLGWVQTSDTGQLNTGTAARPSINSDAGYTVYRMADALQATAPVYLRTDWGVGGSTASLRIKVQTGSTTDGAGTLGGKLSSQVTMSSTSAPSSATTNYYFSGTTGRIQASFAPGVTANGFKLISIERDLNAAGVETSDGIHIVCIWSTGNGSISLSSQFVYYPDGIAAAAESRLCSLISGQASQANASNVAVGAVRPIYGAMRNPSLGMVVCSGADFTDQITNVISLYGVDHTFLALTANWSTGSGLVSNNANARILMRYE